MGRFLPRFKISHQFIIVWLSLSAFLHNILMNGANNVIISSLQKEFYLSSRETGIYVSVYDIGSLLSSILISFASARGSKPRWISFGMVMLFLGCMIVISPHFLKPSTSQETSSSSSSASSSNTVGGELITDENSIELCNQSIYIDGNGQVTYLNRSRSDTNVDVRPKKPDSMFARIFQYKNLLYVGNFINGWSSASMTTITFSYLEDIAPPTLSAMYESAYYATGAFGVGVGFMITSKFLSLHTDINLSWFQSTIHNSLPTWLKPTHPNWIGAWWLPFLAFGFTSLIMALVIFFFPRKIVHDVKPTAKNGTTTTTTTNHNNGTANGNGSGDNNHLLAPPPTSQQQHNGGKEIELTNLSNGNNDENENGHAVVETRDYEQHENMFVEASRNFGSALSINQLGNKSKNYKSEKGNGKKELTLIEKSLLLFKRPVYLFVIIASAIEGLLQNSFLAFATLFLEYQYRLASGSASLILGLLSIPPLIIGGVLSGLIVKKLHNKTSNCFKFLAVVIFFNVIVYAGFMIYCQEPNMISNDVKFQHAGYQVSTQCQCNSKIFKPVCLRESDDIFFQSACLAGCTRFEKSNDTYFECSQVASNGYFTNGLCSTNDSCSLKLIISFACIALLMFLNALTFLPYLKCTIGCIDSREMNSIGLGFKQFFMNAFGTIPGPILFGSIIDLTCKYWHNDLKDQRVCKMYNNQQFAFAFGMLGVGFKSVCFLLVILSIIFLKRSKKNKAKKHLINSN